jgi:hypothetical protein
MELRVNQHALGVRVPQGDNLRPALLRKLPSYFLLARHPGGIWEASIASCEIAWIEASDHYFEG